jgi:hypothetical protein
MLSCSLGHSCIPQSLLQLLLLKSKTNRKVLEVLVCAHHYHNYHDTVRLLHSSAKKPLLSVMKSCLAGADSMSAFNRV